MVLRGATSLRGALEGVGPENRDFFGPWNGTSDLNAGWAYESMISSLTEHTRKCLKVEYLGRIEYDFQKSRATGPWDHKDSVSAKNNLKNFMIVYL